MPPRTGCRSRTTCVCSRAPGRARWTVARPDVTIPVTDRGSRSVRALRRRRGGRRRVGPSPDWMQAAPDAPAASARSATSSTSPTTCCSSSASRCTRSISRSCAGRAIVVRRARAGEKLTTLDGKERALGHRDAGDRRRRARAGHRRRDGRRGLGSVAGHDAGSCSRAAWFNPQSVRATSKKLGLKTEASTRFERGADLDRAASPRCSARCELLEPIGAGRGVGADRRRLPATRTEPRATRTLPRPSSPGSSAWTCPTRGRADPDVARLRRARSARGRRQPDDGVERSRGVPRLARRHAAPGRPHRGSGPPLRLRAPADDVPRRRAGAAAVGSAHRARSRARAARCSAMGFSEAITFAFIEAAAAAPFRGGTRPVALANPLSEKFTVMRPSLLPGLDRRGQPQPPPRPARRAAVRDRHALLAGAAKRAARRWPGPAWRRPSTGAAGAATWTSSTSRASPSSWRRCMGVSPTFDAASRPYLVDGRARRRCWSTARRSARSASSTPAIAEARDLPAGDAGVRRRDRSRCADGARRRPTTLARTPLPRHPGGGARPVDSRRRHLVCRERSWHHSVGRAGHAGRRARVRSLSGQRHSRGQGQPGAAPDVPVGGSHADRRGSAGGDAGHRRRAGRTSTQCSARSDDGTTMATKTAACADSNRSIGSKRRSSCWSASSDACKRRADPRRGRERPAAARGRDAQGAPRRRRRRQRTAEVTQPARASATRSGRASRNAAAAASAPES